MYGANTVSPYSLNVLDVLGTKLTCFLSCHVKLFVYLSHRGKELYATDGTGVLCSPAEPCLACLAPCSQEEAETRLLLHVADAV